MTGQKETHISSARVVVTRVFGVLVLASRAADAVPSRRDMSRPLWKEPR
jgi:hypothetical protein